MCTIENTNFNHLMENLRMEPMTKSHLKVPLCHLVLLPLVRSILKMDIQLLENKLVNGYHEGHGCLCFFF